MKYDLVAIGNALLDFQIPVEESVLREHDIKKGSMTLVEPVYQLRLLSTLKESLPGASFDISSGGSAANTLAGFANYGGKAFFIGKLGRDEIGESYAQDLAKLQIGFDKRTHSFIPTGTCLALITPDGERSMLTCLGAAVELDEQDLNKEALQNTSHLYIEGYLWDSPSARQACREAIKLAKASGAKVSFTFSDSFCVDRHHTDFLGLAKSDVDILFCNEHEALAATGESDVEKAFQVMSGWCETLCVSVGAKGALISENHGKSTDRVPTWDAPVVDKLGAGDLFAAGVLFGLTQKKSLKESAYLGCYSATRIIQQMSARLEEDLSAMIPLALRGPDPKSATAS